MSTSKIKLTRTQLLNLLRVNKWQKTAVAKILKCDEASVRRLCNRLSIDCEIERKANLAETKIDTLTTAQSEIDATIHKGTFVIIPDLHAHTVIWEYLITVCKFITDFKPEYVVQIGDIMDYECLLGISKRKYPTFDGQDMGSLNKEFEAVSNIISMINAATPKNSKKFFLEGNHEYRVVELLRKAPEFADTFKLEKRVDMTGWEILPYLQPLKLGKLNFIHGEFFGDNPIKKHLEVYQKNIVFGHTHTIQQGTKPSPMREIPIWGATIGCLCTLNADYMRNRSSSAQHGFAYGWFEEDSGDFDCKIVRIIHGKFWAEGRKYTS
jgi:hypothetical protein